MSRQLLKVLAGWLLVIGLGIFLLFAYAVFPNGANDYVEGRFLTGGWIVLAIGVIGLLYSSIKALTKWIRGRPGPENR